MQVKNMWSPCGYFDWEHTHGDIRALVAGGASPQRKGGTGSWWSGREGRGIYRLYRTSCRAAHTYFVLLLDLIWFINKSNIYRFGVFSVCETDSLVSVLVESVCGSVLLAPCSWLHAVGSTLGVGDSGIKRAEHGVCLFNNGLKCGVYGGLYGDV